MKKSITPLSLLLLFIFCNANESHGQSYQNQNVNLLSNWFDPAVVAEPFYGIKYNGIWGWADGAGKEYAIIGATHGTYIVEVTNPTSPQFRDFVPGLQTGCIWREYKTYGKYLYMVSDDAAPNGLQIADLSYLPDSVHIVHSSDSIIQRCHTIFVDGNKLYGGGPSGGAVGNVAAMAVYSLANPEAPQLIRKLIDDEPSINYVHDMFVRNDTVYASAGYLGLFIVKLLPNNTFTLLKSLTAYPDQGYNHSGALTENGEIFIFCDEVPGNLAVKSLDVSDFNNLNIKSTFKSNSGATAHNPFMYGNQFVIIAYYKDGLRIFDISDPANVTPAGYFDTYWQNDSCVCYNNTNYDYAGCWGAYPYLPSGNMIASDMQNGLFVLDASSVLGIHNPLQYNDAVTIYPNPVKDNLIISFDLNKNQNVSFAVIDLTGRILMERNMKAMNGKSTEKINLSHISNGYYILRVTGRNFSETKKIIKVD